MVNVGLVIRASFIDTKATSSLVIIILISYIFYLQYCFILIGKAIIIYIPGLNTPVCNGILVSKNGEGLDPGG